MKKILMVFVMLMTAVIILTGCNSNEKEKIIIRGSTSVEPIMEKLMDEFLKTSQGKNVEFDIKCEGSGKGREAAENDTVGNVIGMSSSAIKGEDASKFSQFDLAKDAVVVIVNKNNNTTNLNVNEVYDIYTGVTKKFTGIETDITVIARDAASGTREAFESLIKNSEGVKLAGNMISAAEQLEKTSAVIAKVKTVESAIGYISLGSLGTTTKVISINGVEPTVENVKNGNYYYCDLNKLNDNTYTLVLNNITERKNNENIRSEFFANASHELKTPLTAIKGFNEVIITQNQDHNLDKYLDNINKETNRVLILIEDMLKLSRLEMKTEIDYREVDMLNITNEIVNQLQSIIDKNKINLLIEGNIVVNGEKEHFYELLKNLIENAIKYNIEDGNVVVTFSENNFQKIIEVKDNGIGIDYVDQPRIFERFYIVNKSRSRNTGGTGLGLAIVKHIVQLYNGNIELNSSLGAGTTIKILFPKW